MVGLFCVGVLSIRTRRGGPRGRRHDVRASSGKEAGPGGTCTGSWRDLDRQTGRQSQVPFSPGNTRRRQTDLVACSSGRAVPVLSGRSHAEGVDSAAERVMPIQYIRVPWPIAIFGAEVDVLICSGRDRHDHHHHATPLPPLQNHRSSTAMTSRRTPRLVVCGGNGFLGASQTHPP